MAKGAAPAKAKALAERSSNSSTEPVEVMCTEMTRTRRPQTDNSSQASSSVSSPSCTRAEVRKQ
eukprot:12925744-Prorocentrum_lima.AAC.1